MKEILKPMFEWVVDQYTLFENPLYDWIVALIIGAIGFALAWNFVGHLYDSGDIHCSAAGSIIHWIVRLIVVSLLYLFVAAIIWSIKLVLSVPWWGWIIVVGAIAIISVVAIFIKHRIRRS